MSETELTHRMRARYQRMLDASPSFQLPSGGGRVEINVHEFMAAMAEEVRAYDREQRAAVGHEHLHEKVRDDAKVTFEICRRPNCTRPRPTLPEEASG